MLGVGPTNAMGSTSYLVAQVSVGGDLVLSSGQVGKGGQSVRKGVSNNGNFKTFGLQFPEFFGQPCHKS